MITGLAHAAICVPDVEAATSWYRDVLGCRVLSPPYRMEGDAISRDMGELVPPPVVVKGSILGFGDGDHVLELVEYSSAELTVPDVSIVHTGVTHVGLVCTDLDGTRAELESRGVVFLTKGSAKIAGLRTTWFRDPWTAVFILMEKRDADRPYWRQY